jgi:hypothetical protein
VSELSLCSRETPEATAEMAATCDGLPREGVIVQPNGVHKNVLTSMPAELLAPKSAECFVAAPDRVLSAMPTLGTWIACASEHGSARSCSSCSHPAWWPD